MSNGEAQICWICHITDTTKHLTCCFLFITKNEHSPPYSNKTQVFYLVMTSQILMQLEVHGKTERKISRFQPQAILSLHNRRISVRLSSPHVNACYPFFFSCFARKEIAEIQWAWLFEGLTPALGCAYVLGSFPKHQPHLAHQLDQDGCASIVGWLMFLKTTHCSWHLPIRAMQDHRSWERSQVWAGQFTYTITLGIATQTLALFSIGIVKKRCAALMATCHVPGNRPTCSNRHPHVAQQLSLRLLFG